MIIVGIIDIDIGSLSSIKACMNNMKVKSECFSDPKNIFKYKYVILPGVGNFEYASVKLHENNWGLYIKEFLNNNENRLMGICLGFQVLFESSEESINAKGLGLISGKIEKLKSSESERIPHVGWNDVIPLKKNSYLNFLENPMDVYFVHSYGLLLNQNLNEDLFHEFTVTRHGKNKFLSSFRLSNLYGCQFHPEKSSKVGTKFLKLFLELNA